MSLSLFHNKSSHSLGWWLHCLSATHLGSLLWLVPGARRHPWVWLLFHRSLAGEFRQVCIPDRMAKVMTDIPVWDTLDIYFSALSDMAAPVSSRAWTCSPAISSHIQNCDSTAISGPLKPYVVWLDTEKHLRNGLPLRSMRRLAGRMFTTSCQFFVGTVIRVQVHRPLRICERGPQYCLRSLVCSKELTHLDAGSCSGLLLIHAGL